MGKTRIMLADDHAVLRAGLRTLLAGEPDMEVVGEASDMGQASIEVARLSPDVLVLDLSMPGGSPIQLIKRLHQTSPNTRSLVFTMHNDPVYLRSVLAAGGLGYVVKTAPEPELLAAIRAVAAGRTFVDLDQPESSGTAVKEHPVAARAGLSSREQQVLLRLAQGHTNQEIANRLFLSVKTIETYRARIADKLGLRTRADIVRYAVELGILTGS
jgi:two-component system, NarL family, response regulator NreC